jgi:putative ATP-dependent endonuclease of the OLD family
LRIQEFIRKIEIVFRPDEAGRERSLEELSDGQRSLFRLAMTAATLDVEAQIVAGTAGAAFKSGAVVLPALTLIAVEEPENNLAPFYLSRVIQQIENLTGERAQAMVSSHSASILVRIDPEQVRHFRLDLESRSALVRTIRMPPELEQAPVFVREAVVRTGSGWARSASRKHTVDEQNGDGAREQESPTHSARVAAGFRY